MDAIEEAEVVALCSNNSESNSASSNNTASNNDQQCALAVVKGKRTKRQRLQPCLAPGTATASASSNSSDVEVSSSTTEEDEDMANCLILLARGRAAPNAAVPHPVSSAEEAIALINRAPAEKFTSRRFTETATTTEGKAGFYVYECKTCNKCFPSFQALGGHRASHKKPKIAAPADEKKTPTELVDEDSLQIGMNSFSKAVAAPSSNTSVSAVNTKPRVHECSICGSEFSSGQALGGHMRRHRPLTVAESSPEMKKERNVLSLDLNLPAPSDDGNGEFAKPPATAVAFQFESKPSLVFSASALVGCHY